MKFHNPITKRYHLKWDRLHYSIHKEIKDLNLIRGRFDEIIRWKDIDNHSSPSERFIGAHDILEIFKPALTQEYCEFDRHKRGIALNHDLYGYDTEQGVAVVQARQSSREYKNGYLNSRKTYFLVGCNENTNQFFRHPVSPHTVRAAIRKDPSRSFVVRAAQKWMWNVTDNQLNRSLRQGDILLVPEKRIPEQPTIGTTLTLSGSHQIKADDIRLRSDGWCYALNPTLTHTKGQHAPVIHKGWCSVIMAREFKAWTFAERVGD